MGYQSPLGDSSQTVQFQSKLFTSSFLQAAVAGAILGIDFLSKFRIPVATENDKSCLLVRRQPKLPPNPLCLAFLSMQLDHLHHGELLHCPLHTDGEGITGGLVSV
jgi:hypothetical protein